MWYLDNIRLVNFKSHRDTTIEFNKNKTTLIYGINEDDKGADSNGAGKSSIVEAITILLLDVYTKELNQEDFINDQSTFSELIGELSNPLIKAKLGIHRIFRRNHTSVCSISDNGIPNEVLVSVAEKNKYVLQRIGITKDDILNYFIINQDNSNSFFMASDMQKKEIIGRFTNSVTVDKLIEFVAEDLYKIDTNIQSNNNLIDAAQAQIESLEESLTYEKEERLKEYNEEMVLLQDKVKELKREVTEELNKLNTSKTEKTMKDKQLVNLTKQKVDDNISSDIQTKEKLLRILQTERRESIVIKNDLEIKIDGNMVCPKCKYKWSTIDPTVDFKTLEETLKQCKEVINTYEFGIDLKETEISGLRKKLDDQKTSASKRIQINNAIENIEKSIGYTERNIKTLKEQLTSNTKKLEELKVFKKNIKRIQDLEAERRKKLEEVGILVVNNEKLTEQKKNYEFWKVNFGLLGFKTFLVNKTLSIIESVVNSFLYRFEMNLLVKINGFKVLKSKEVREKIDILVSKNEQIWSKFRKFSGGQRKRINICGILALQTLINSASDSGGLDFMVLDETFESLDNAGQLELLRILDKSQQTNLVISHQNNDIGRENQIFVKYKNGESCI